MTPCQVLVSDSSVLIDIERGALLDAAFSLSYELCVPDLLYHQELADFGGERLVALGLKVQSLDGKDVARSQGYRRAVRALSRPDCFALSLAARSGYILLTGDSKLRGLAATEGVACHGLLWLLDRIEREGTASGRCLRDGLAAIFGHPRCRLPEDEVQRRLARYQRQADAHDGDRTRVPATTIGE